MELHESRLMYQSDDDSIPKGGYMEQYADTLRQAAVAAGFEADLPPQLAGYLRAAGFVDVQVVVKKLPIGTWPRTLAQKVCGVCFHSELCGYTKWGRLYLRVHGALCALGDAPALAWIGEMSQC